MEYNSFDKEPWIKVNPRDTKKPFTLMNNICYLSCGRKGLETKNAIDSYVIEINKGYNWNGANIPKFLWRVVGSQYNPEFLPASMIHDWFCENKGFLYTKGVYISSLIFRDILLLYKVPKWKANLMFTAVYLFQKTRKGWKQ
jgi:hypothetical protein